MTFRSAGPSFDHDVLALWEAAAQAAAPRLRDGALLDAAGLPTPRTLGERNARLLELHTRLFGDEVELLSHCPRCGTAAQFVADMAAMARALAVPAANEPHELDTLGHTLRFRLPNSHDIDAAVAGDAIYSAAGADANAAADTPDDADRAFARSLLARCIVAGSRDGTPVSASELPDAVLDAVSQRIEALDPGAALSFALDCPQCAASWSAPLDAGELVWRRLRAAAERLLLDVDALARTYGWSEPEVLALGPVRRAAYLRMAAA